MSLILMLEGVDVSELKKMFPSPIGVMSRIPVNIISNTSVTDEQFPSPFGVMSLIRIGLPLDLTTKGMFPSPSGVMSLIHNKIRRF